jgi:hypothetical protein
MNILSRCTDNKALFYATKQLNQSTGHLLFIQHSMSNRDCWHIFNENELLACNLTIPQSTWQYMNKLYIQLEKINISLFPKFLRNLELTSNGYDYVKYYLALDELMVLETFTLNLLPNGSDNDSLAFPKVDKVTLRTPSYNCHKFTIRDNRLKYLELVSLYMNGNNCTIDFDSCVLMEKLIFKTFNNTGKSDELKYIKILSTKIHKNFKYTNFRYIKRNILQNFPNLVFSYIDYLDITGYNYYEWGVSNIDIDFYYLNNFNNTLNITKMHVWECMDLTDYFVKFPNIDEIHVRNILDQKMKIDDVQCNSLSENIKYIKFIYSCYTYDKNKSETIRDIVGDKYLEFIKTHNDIEFEIDTCIDVIIEEQIDYKIRINAKSFITYGTDLLKDFLHLVHEDTVGIEIHTLKFESIDLNIFNEKYTYAIQADESYGSKLFIKKINNEPLVINSEIFLLNPNYYNTTHKWITNADNIKIIMKNSYFNIENIQSENIELYIDGYTWNSNKKKIGKPKSCKNFTVIFDSY